MRDKRHSLCSQGADSLAGKVGQGNLDNTMIKEKSKRKIQKQWNAMICTESDSQECGER